MVSIGQEDLPLAGIHVVELADVKGQLCGKVLADFGAEVTLVEPPTGCPARSIGPFASGVPAPENSLYFAYFNANKKGVTLDLNDESGRAAMHRLLGVCDVFLEGTTPGTLESLGLDYRALRQFNPGLIMASITGFGQTGPFRNYKCPEIVAYAMGGQMWLNGKFPKEPACPPVEIVYPMASLLTCFSVLAALHWRDKSGWGQHIDASLYEALAGCMFQLTNFSASSSYQRRQAMRNRHPAGNGAPFGTYHTGDGRYVHISGARPWNDFVDWLGQPPELAESAWADPAYRARNADAVDDLVERFTLQHTMAELTAPGAMRHHTIGPVGSPTEFMNDPQSRSRRSFYELSHPALGRYPCPRPPLLSRTPMWKIARSAPLLGQDNESVNASLAPAAANATARLSNEPAPKGALPLAGMRILDFSQAIAGPLGLQWMTQLGAEVLKVDSTHASVSAVTRGGADPIRRATSMAQHGEHFMGKRSVQVNMSTNEGRSLVLDLVKQCDVVIANFTPGVLESWGMDYNSLRAINPRIIVAVLSGYGQEGPRSQQTSIGPHCMAACGLNYLWHYPDDNDPEPLCSVIWASDYIATGYLVSSILAAARQRRRTGEGQYIDLSQIETNASIMGHMYMDAALNGADNQERRFANPQWAPYAAFRCKGEDQWCVIAVTTEDEWRAMCEASGHRDWLEDERFASNAARRSHLKELRQAIESWTTQRSPFQAMRMFQQQGVPAGVVQTGEDLYRCPQLRDRGFIHSLLLPDGTSVEVPGSRVKLSLTPGRMGGYLELGEANEYVFGELLGATKDTIAALAAKGVFE